MCGNRVSLAGRKMEPDLIKLNRIGSTPWGTLGKLELPGGWSCCTMEPRWEHNARGVSCIPSGVYRLEKRTSPIVDKTTGGIFHQGWEIDGVPGRDLIMIHPGNWATDSNGCVLVGRSHEIIAGLPGVSSSRVAFQDLMKRMDSREEWRIEIRWFNPEGK
jgi:hypothetical protein